MLDSTSLRCAAFCGRVPVVLMRKPLVAGNWKMHGTFDSIGVLVDGLRNAELGVADVVVFPPMVYLDRVRQMLAASGLGLGAQTLSDRKEGAFTGEVSGAMLVDVGCRYVLVGHSERRTHYGERDSTIAARFAAALDVGLIPVLCVGETLQQRQEGRCLEVICAQVRVVMERVGTDALAGSILAYEPLWAVGTGITARPEQAQEVHAGLRAMLGTNGAKTRILYGGSVKPENAGELFAQPDIDGALVGGASLEADQFAAICRLAS